eukprot:8506247-Ditylum_brightwellii.AAC.1
MLTMMVEGNLVIVEGVVKRGNEGKGVGGGTHHSHSGRHGGRKNEGRSAGGGRLSIMMVGMKVMLEVIFKVVMLVGESLVEVEGIVLTVDVVAAHKKANM